MNSKIPIIDHEKCTRCGDCVSICEPKAILKSANSNCDKCSKYCIEYNVDCYRFYIRIDEKKCTSCGKCIEICPEKALSL